MRESISSCQNSEQVAIEVATQIGCTALDIVDATYGSGMPLWTPGRQELSFHNGHHGRTVGKAGALMAHTEGLSPLMVAIAEAAGNAHDINQLDGRGTDEAKSAAWLVSQMEVTKAFSKEACEIGRLAIIGTQPIFDENFNLVGQHAAELTYPSIEAEKVALSVACGDLSEIYQPQGPLTSHQLFREIKGMLPADELPMDELVSFQQKQLALLDNYTYPLASAERVLATHKPEVIAYSEQVLEQLEQGTIDSWRTLIEQDTAFMQTHA